MITIKETEEDAQSVGSWMRFRKSESDDSILEWLSKSSLDIRQSNKFTNLKLSKKISNQSWFSLMQWLSKIEPLNELLEEVDS